ncbi:MAG: GAP family protein [Thermoleophilia bacterium]
MSSALLLSLAGLAVLDSANTSTLTMVVVILFAARRPAATGWAYAVGAIVMFFAIAVGLYLGASAASDVVAEFGLWARRVIFTMMTVVLMWFGIRRLRSRERRGLPKLPTWVNPMTGTLLGALATIGDLPNAFPLFLAIDRLIDAAIPTDTSILLLIGYTAIYALPTLVLLVVGLTFRERVIAWLERVLRRFTTGTSKASWRIASLFFVGAIASATIVMLQH